MSEPITIDTEVLREIIIKVLLEECTDVRANALTLEAIEAKNVAGLIIDAAVSQTSV